MKRTILLKIIVVCTLILTGCNKDDDNKENQGCVKDENFFEATFNGETIEPHYVQGGGFGLYTLYLERCSSNENNWLLSITTETSPNLYLNLNAIAGPGNYVINAGDVNHLFLDCDDIISLYLRDEATNSYTFISSSNGTIEITEYDSGSEILVGTFTSEMVSTADPSIKKTITGDFNLNKSTLDNTKKPCWL